MEIDIRPNLQLLKIAWNTVKYNVEKLVEAGLVIKRGGKLSVAEDIFSEAVGSG